MDSGSTATLNTQRNSNAEMMKSIQKARLSRKALADPSFISELVKLESTAVYNTKGDVVQAVSGSLGSV
ncbi:MAG: hypothetical protein KKB70_02155 [Proteobacteria bacterium]|nr:hypothetical protein [Pseudomonadota bacterium]MBU1610823.1 hypothetical protein [Pseudomonadota bacterium]